MNKTDKLSEDDMTQPQFVTDAINSYKAREPLMKSVNLDRYEKALEYKIDRLENEVNYKSGKINNG